MTNSWAMLYDHLDPEGFDYGAGAAQAVPMPGAAGEDVITFNIPSDHSGCVDIITGEPLTEWKYSEDRILNEVERYLASTYQGHYVGESNKIQTLDLIDSNGDAEAFCRANIIKYASRFGKKDGKNPKDLLKVIHYAFLLYHFSEVPFSE